MNGGNQMANIKSAKKRIRTINKKTARNIRVKNHVTEAEKAFLAAVQTADVEAAEKDENSILNYYRKLLKLRKENPIIIYGDFKMYNKLSRKLFVYERSYEGQRMLVINSFSEKPVKFKAPADFDITKSELLISNYDCKDKSNAFTLRPYESRAYLIK